MQSLSRLTAIAVLTTFGCSKPTHPLPIAVDPAQIEAELKRVQTLNDSLDSGGPPKMLAAGLSCPVIHSKYYADRISDRQPKLRKLEEARREFGLKLSRALDELGERFQQPATSDERAKQATLALDLAAWLNAAKGWGNYRLFSRCESLATVPLAYLVADLSYPIETIHLIRARMSSPLDERMFRVTVLNDEAPKEFVGSLVGDDKHQEEEVIAAWGKGMGAMNDWFLKRSIKPRDWRRNMLPDELAFFWDDSYSAPLTTTHLWDLKLHANLVYGLRDIQIRNVDGFIVFREKVGAFPLTPPKWWSPGMYHQSAIEVAFEEAWKPFRREFGWLNQTAAIMYTRVVEGRVMDEEAWEIRMAAAEKARREKRP